MFYRSLLSSSYSSSEASTPLQNSKVKKRPAVAPVVTSASSQATKNIKLPPPPPSSLSSSSLPTSLSPSSHSQDRKPDLKNKGSSSSQKSVNLQEISFQPPKEVS
eukprot:Awhi_evm2s2332